LRRAKVVRLMTEPAQTSGWKLDRDQRARLLQRVPPTWPDVVADHVTLWPMSVNAPAPGAVVAELVGRRDDGAGVEAMVVAIDGSTDRPDGSIYHITWSLDRRRGREARDSNDVLAELGWEPLAFDEPLVLHPARWG
jgi:hypothetical protein